MRHRWILCGDYASTPKKASVFVIAEFESETQGRSGREGEHHGGKVGGAACGAERRVERTGERIQRERSPDKEEVYPLGERESIDQMRRVRLCHSSHETSTEPSHFADRARLQAEMASFEF